MKKEKCICKHCNKEFFTYKSRVKDGRGKFCSRKCMYATSWNKGIPWSEEYKKKLSEIGKKLNHHYWLGKKRPEMALRNKKGKYATGYKNALGNKLTEECKKRLSELSKIRWLNKDYAKKVLGRRQMSSLEVKIQKVIDKYHLPYKFVGNGEFWIERMNPDFININGEKTAVEVYWKEHKEKFVKGGMKNWMNKRINICKKYGWKMIFIEGTKINENIILNYLEGGC